MCALFGFLTSDEELVLFDEQDNKHCTGLNVEWFGTLLPEKGCRILEAVLSTSNSVSNCHPDDAGDRIVDEIGQDCGREQKALRIDGGSARLQIRGQLPDCLFFISIFFVYFLTRANGQLQKYIITIIEIIVLIFILSSNFSRELSFAPGLDFDQLLNINDALVEALVE
jgi:hypothetical protein